MAASKKLNTTSKQTTESKKVLAQPVTEKLDSLPQKVTTKATKKDKQTLAEKTVADKKVAKPATKSEVPKSEVKFKSAKKKVQQQKMEEKIVSTEIISITFQLRYNTSYGQQLFITANHPLLGNGNMAKALPMQYFNNEYWYAQLVVNKADIKDEDIIYNYALQNIDGTIQYDCGNDKKINLAKIVANEILLLDGWNFTGYIQNTFYTEPFKEVLLPKPTAITLKEPKKFTHIFQTKTPALPQHHTLCLVGNTKSLHSWDTENPILMHYSATEQHYKTYLDLSKDDFPVAYKYGVFDTKNNIFIRFEDGDNRIVYDACKPEKITIINDAFANLPITNWRGAGVAIPVFSLKTNNSFGVGEFTDLIELANWSEQVGLKLIQILPINDTTATHTWQDSYPYAAISAFALHPIYINLQQATDTINDYLLRKLDAQQQELNAKDVVDYEEVLKVKLNYLKKIYPLQSAKTFAIKEFKEFFKNNKHWLIPYASFCYLRDEYKTANYNEWPAYRHFNPNDIEELTNENSAAYNDIAFHYFVQFHLHTQLLQATKYAHSKGIIVKGDIPIGIYRYGVDAWQQPELYHMNVQAGAPPDDFAVKGQNWGFPTYNWNKMKEDDFAWWRKRFEQMSYYFDAFRIDHILGFFRIWSIPLDAVEGIMGHFVPAIPVHINELMSRNIQFNHHRFTKPYINDSIIWDEFDYDSDEVKETFLEIDGYGNYNLKSQFTTQRSVEKHFAALEQNEKNEKLKIGLYNLISNVLLFEVENSNAQQFHFRFGIENISSYRHLDYYTQQQLKELYIDYFFKRQDAFWEKEALQKLPALRRVTNMLICGEDLGLVPACVPDVMKQLGLLSLEIQRMPKDSTRQFFHPNDAPYLSVVTPSTHDMSTIRGWWEEDKNLIQKFYNNELGQWGNAPYYCEAWINKAIVVQHLYSPAMWAIFQLQDLLGIDENLRRENPNDERINVPANPKHYWQYRMNLTIEELQAAKEFNEVVKQSVKMSGR